MAHHIVFMYFSALNNLQLHTFPNAFPKLELNIFLNNALILIIWINGELYNIQFFYLCLN